MDPLHSAADALLLAEIFGGKDIAVDWSKLTYGRSYVGTVTHQTYTYLDITGPGILDSLSNNGSVSSLTFAVQIDGGPIERYVLNGFSSPEIQQGTVFLRRKFNTSLKVTASSAPGSTYDVIAFTAESINGELNHKNWTPHSAIVATNAHGGQTHVDIAGSGYLVGLQGDGMWRVQIDGGAIRYYVLGQRAAKQFSWRRFNTSLKVTTLDSSQLAADNRMVHYLLD